jgi:hypothetical protein
MMRERWHGGQTALFEYHCNESHDSAHAEVWYRSHQPVTVLKMTEPGMGETYIERGENGSPRCYRVRWADGYRFEVFEDELTDSAEDWHRPDPPARTAQEVALREVEAGN